MTVFACNVACTHTSSFCVCVCVCVRLPPFNVTHWVVMTQRWQEASITDGVLFYLHNTSCLGHWCGFCKTAVDLWEHFHACYHRKYVSSACVIEVKSLCYNCGWQLYTRTTRKSRRAHILQVCFCLSAHDHNWPQITGTGEQSPDSFTSGCSVCVCVYV